MKVSYDGWLRTEPRRSVSRVCRLSDYVWRFHIIVVECCLVLQEKKENGNESSVV